MLTGAILIGVLYVLPAYGNYKTTQWLHRNRWTYVDPGIGDLLFTFIPLLNIISVLTDFHTITETKHSGMSKLIRKFFRI